MVYVWSEERGEWMRECFILLISGARIRDSFIFLIPGARISNRCKMVLDWHLLSNVLDILYFLLFCTGLEHTCINGVCVVRGER